MRKFFKAVSLTAALFLTGALSGCGFTPLHSTGGASAALADIDIDILKGSSVVDNQAGFFVLQRVRDRIGIPSEAAPYRLEDTPLYRRRRLGLTNADVASRYDITVRARWTLFDAKSGKRLEGGSSESIVTFGAPDGPFGVITADNVGVEQASQETADKLIIDLARYFSSEKAQALK